MQVNNCKFIRSNNVKRTTQIVTLLQTFRNECSVCASCGRSCWTAENLCDNYVLYKASFTRTVNFTVFVSSTFDLFDGYFDRLNECLTHLPVNLSVTIDTMLNFDDDLMNMMNGDVTCKRDLKGCSGIFIVWSSIVKTNEKSTKTERLLFKY